MATFKIHIAKQIVKGKVMNNKTECGRNAFTPNGSINMIYKSNAFKQAFEGGDECCQICLNKAKEQGRL